MKKAKEYAAEVEKRIFAGDDPDEIAKYIYLALTKEGYEIAETRHAKSEGAIKSIFEEQNNKWNAIVRRTNIGMVKDGFMALTEKRIKELL